MKIKLKDLMVPKILWQGSQIGCMKTACTLNCKLCMVERKAICSLWRSNKSKIINNKSEIFGSCKCKTRFHKFTKVQPTSGTEEAFIAEKSQFDKENSSPQDHPNCREDNFEHKKPAPPDSMIKIQNFDIGMCTSKNCIDNPSMCIPTGAKMSSVQFDLLKRLGYKFL